MVRRYVKNYSTPNDPKFSDQWHLHNTGQSEAIAGVDGRVAEAWDITRGSPEVIIAINDDGVDINHPDLATNCTAPLNFPSDWEQQLGDPMAGFGNHGTSVAGVAAAIGDNDQGGSGVCPGCKIMPHVVGEAVGVALQMTDQEIADGFALMVDQGAWIISNSWGPGAGDPEFKTSSFPVPGVPSIIKNAFAYAETNGRGGKGT
ncbi:MAG: S8 family serine peptidase, partial [Polyangiaceae bacterium]|nr:S8 family serine peptidase [Polyangiaceae bacterium]